MATSGVITASYTVGDVVTSAMRRLRILGKGETPESDDMEDGIERLGLMLKTWAVTGPKLFTRAEQSVTLVDGTQSYTLTTRPFSVQNVRLAVDGDERYPMTEWSRQDWDQSPIKDSEGTPIIYVVDRQISGTSLTLWPIPDIPSGEAWTLNVSYERVPYDVTASSETLDIPQEWHDCIIDSLGYLLADEFGVSGDHVERMGARAAAMFTALMGNEREGEIRFYTEA